MLLRNYAESIEKVEFWPGGVQLLLSGLAALPFCPLCSSYITRQLPLFNNRRCKINPGFFWFFFIDMKEPPSRRRALEMELLGRWGWGRGLMGSVSGLGLGGWGVVDRWWESRGRSAVAATAWFPVERANLHPVYLFFLPPLIFSCFLL